MLIFEDVFGFVNSKKMIHASCEIVVMWDDNRNADDDDV